MGWGGEEEGWKHTGGVVMVTKVEEAGVEGGKFGQREEVECEAGANVGKDESERRSTRNNQLERLHAFPWQFLAK